MVVLKLSDKDRAVFFIVDGLPLIVGGYASSINCRHSNFRFDKRSIHVMQMKWLRRL